MMQKMEDERFNIVWMECDECGEQDGPMLEWEFSVAEAMTVCTFCDER